MKSNGWQTLPLDDISNDRAVIFVFISDLLSSVWDGWFYSLHHGKTVLV